MKNFARVSAGLAALVVVGTASAQDCSEIGDSLEAAPQWYVDQCTTGEVGGYPRGAQAPGAFAFDLNSDTILSHPQDDFSLAVATGGTSTATIFAMESSADGSEIWVIDVDTNDFGVLDPNTGAITVIGTATPLPGHTWTGITANANGAWALSSDGATSTLYSLDPTTGAMTEIGSQTDDPFMIDLAVTCEGEMYGHGIASDSLYSIDPTTGTVTLIGPTGFAANFAQGMTVDRTTGEIYGYLYDSAVGDTQYGTFDTVTGAFQVINAATAPSDELEGATTTSCVALVPPEAEPVPLMRGTGLLVLMISLMLIGGLAVRRIAG